MYNRETAGDTDYMPKGPIPQKPYPEFPLTPHASGKWTKKVRGRFYYFGRWDDPDGALREYNAVKQSLVSGRDPTVADPNTITIRDLFNAFLDRQTTRVDAGRLDGRTYTDQRQAMLQFARAVGPGRMVAELRPADFAAGRSALAIGKKGRGPMTLNRAIANVRAAFNHGRKNLMFIGDVAFGDKFDKEPIRVLRKASREANYKRGKKLFSPRECRDLVAAAQAPLKAMILLGLNSGFYAADVSALPRAALNLEKSWLEFPRTKTEVTRAAPLWPETVAALREAIAIRPDPRSEADSGLVFITKQGERFVHNAIKRGATGIERATRSDAINQAFKRLLVSLDMRRPGVNFAALRSTFRTAADELNDPNAVLLMMGHSFKGMDQYYLQEVARKRMKRVADHLRRKLLNPKKVRATAKARAGKPRKRRR
jgi:integrase